MAIPWLTVLSNIPWRDVITTAPKVAEEAKKLWTRLNRHPTPKPHQDSQSPVEKSIYAGDEHALEVAHRKITILEADLADIKAQMMESSTLIKALADQNAQLVKHIEINRSRLKMLAVVLAIFIGIAIFAIFKMQAML
jgi:hypothetical protein